MLQYQAVSNREPTLQLLHICICHVHTEGLHDKVGKQPQEDDLYKLKVVNYEFQLVLHRGGASEFSDEEG
ncbi:hypothetical protein ACP70R_043987 [Stipagrostis hirtigluma subsp. patula]